MNFYLSEKEEGDLTIKGKTHSQEMTATVFQKGSVLEAKVEMEIADRTLFDVKYNSAQYNLVSELKNKLIQDHIKLEMDLKAE